MGSLVNPYGFGGGVIPAYPLTNSAAGPTTTASGGTSTILSLPVLAAQFTANATYLGLASLEALASTTGNPASQISVNNGAVLTNAALNFKQLSSPQDKRAVLTLFRYQPGASPTDKTFDLKITAAIGNTATGQNSRITLLKLGSDDFSAIDLTGGTTFSSGYVTFLTLNFTPASAGDYVILGYVRSMANGGGYFTGAKLVCAGQTIEYFGQSADFGDSPFVFILPLVGLSGAQTATIQIKSNNIATLTVDDLHLFAIRRSRFDAVYSARLGASAAGTETAYTEAHSTTNTPAAVPHLAIAAWGSEGSLITESIFSHFTDDGVVIAENIVEPRGNAVGQNSTMSGAHTVATYAASSRKHAIDRKSEAGATSRIQIEAGIVVFNLNGF